MEYKTCSRCNENLPINNFHKDNHKKCGLRSECIKCHKKHTKKNERSTEPKKCKKCNIVKPALEFTTNIKSNDGLYNNCRECSSYLKKEYKHKNFKNFIKYLYQTARNRSLLKKNTFNLTEDEWIDIYNNQKGKCALTGIEMTISKENNNYNISPDRIDSDKGYTKDNIQFVCAQVNLAKHEYTNTEFIEMCRQVANFNTPT